MCPSIPSYREAHAERAHTARLWQNSPSFRTLDVYLAVGINRAEDAHLFQHISCIELCHHEPTDTTHQKVNT